MQEYKERLKLAQLEEAAKMEPSKVVAAEEAK